jgi:hypothetical protein
MTRGRREELDFDPLGLRHRACPSCERMVAVRIKREPDGTRRMFCSKCGEDLADEEADGFGVPKPNLPDA